MIVTALYHGEPREIQWRGQTVRTGIFKEPCAGPLTIIRGAIVGDGQADLSVHGGVRKALYAYAAEHYDWWTHSRGERPEPGAFGENLTVSGLDEGHVAVGEIYRVGSALLAVTEPRFPCYKLGIRFADPRMVKAFYRSRRNGVYFAILEDGEIAMGDRCERISQPDVRFTIRHFADVERSGKIAPDDWEKIRSSGILSDKWLRELGEKIANQNG